MPVGRSRSRSTLPRTRTGLCLGPLGGCNGRERMTAHLWRLGAAAPLLAFGLTLAASEAEFNPKAVIYQLPEQFKWRDPTGAAPVNNVILHGDPSKPGFYVVLNRWKAGNNFSRPHFHPNDRFITVIKGTWWMGSGTKFDPDNSVPCRPERSSPMWASKSTGT